MMPNGYTSDRHAKKLILMMMLQVQETAPGSADGLVMQRDALIRFTVKNR